MNIRLLCLVPLMAITFMHPQKVALKITNVEISSGLKGAPTPTVNVLFTFNDGSQKSVSGRSTGYEQAAINLQDPQNQNLAALLQQALGLTNVPTELGIQLGSSVGTPGDISYKNFLTTINIQPLNIQPKPKKTLMGGPGRRAIFCNGACQEKPEKHILIAPQPEHGQALTQIQTGDVPHEEFNPAQQ